MWVLKIYILFLTVLLTDARAYVHINMQVCTYTPPAVAAVPTERAAGSQCSAPREKKLGIFEGSCRADPAKLSVTRGQGPF